jgi:hypothetical protein
VSVFFWFKSGERAGHSSWLITCSSELSANACTELLAMWAVVVSLWKTHTNFRLQSFYKESVSELILHNVWNLLFCPIIGSFTPPPTISARHLDFQIMWRHFVNSMRICFGPVLVVSTFDVSTQCKLLILRIKHKLWVQKIRKQRFLRLPAVPNSCFTVLRQKTMYNCCFVGS